MTQDKRFALEISDLLTEIGHPAAKKVLPYENMGKAEQWLKEEEITQYWCRPNKPKDKPFIERFIGTLQTECPDYHYEPMDVHGMQEIIDEWIFKYENQRPHERLGFLTPKQFEALFYVPKHSPVSYF